jgi:hypothetical protein
MQSSRFIHKVDGAGQIKSPTPNQQKEPITSEKKRDFSIVS